MFFLPIAIRSLRHDSDKKILFLLLLLRSIRHDYDKKANYFSFQHYFHYTIIIRISHDHGKKITYFHSKTTFTTKYQKFSVSKRFVHDTVVSPSGTSVESQHFFFLRKFSVFKRFVHDTLVSSSGTSVESYMLYYPNLRAKNLLNVSSLDII